MRGEDLTELQARSAMDEIMGGRATASQIGAFIVALRAKGETVDEMVGLVEGMREAAVRVELGGPLLDTAGTGGDRSGTFNISTLAALIAAGAGAKVAKHGNRSASSQCGSADLLEGLGIALDLDPAASARMVEEVGFGFFFAPRYHPAMRHAGPVREELGVPTVFNFLGPLANPAGATHQAIGVAAPEMAERMVGVLQRLGTELALVYYGHDGLDEVTIAAPSTVYRLANGQVSKSDVTPEDFGVSLTEPAALVGGDLDTNIAIAHFVLSGEAGPRRDVSLVNAAVALVAAGLASDWREGMAMAAESVDSGAAGDVLARAAAMSAELAG